MNLLRTRPESTAHFDHVAPIAFPAVLLVAATAALLCTSPTHSLLQGSTAAGSIALFLAFRARHQPISQARISPEAAGLGSLFAVSLLAQRAAGSSIWWSLTLLPLLLLVFRRLLGTVTQSPLLSPVDSNGAVGETKPSSWRQLLLLLSGVAFISNNAVIDLSGFTHGTLNAAATGAAMYYLEALLTIDTSSRISLLDEKQSAVSPQDAPKSILGGAAAVSALLCGAASAAFEPHAASFSPKSLAGVLSLAVALGATVKTVRHFGALQTSGIWSTAAILSAMARAPTAAAIPLGLLLLSLMMLESGIVARQLRLKPPQINRGSSAILVILGILLLGFGFKSVMDHQLAALRDFASNANMALSTSGGFESYTVHPVEYLVYQSQQTYDAKLQRQSKTLSAAVATYKKRFGIPPPPQFDKWYEFARQYDVEMIDEFDTIHESMIPFWAVSPHTLRTRVVEALGYENNGLISLIIRDGQVVSVEGGQGWQQASLRGLVSKFVHLLPDLDIAFNMHDEPRILVPHDELSRMVAHAKQVALPAALSRPNPRNSFSPRPADMDDSGHVAEMKTSRFNEYAHQSTWVPSRLSCPPDSPARDFRNGDASLDRPYEADNATLSVLGSLGFIQNLTAATDICSFPSLKSTHGFFNRPNAFKVAHELIPIFSESKVSSFQDILFPSMWHWNRRIPAGHNRTEDMHLPGLAQPMYDPASDTLSWDEKIKTLYWRGSTTGGYSVNGAWRNHHRQILVRMLHAQDRTRVLVPTAQNGSAVYAPQTIARSTIAPLFNVSFAGVGQCSPADCHAQEEFFALAPYAPPATAWRHAHLLDMDGNAFSARFYALLSSGALVHKMAVFREWHDEWLRPWVHYVPLSLRGDEWAEQVRFLTHEGDAVAQKVAKRGREWAQRGPGRREVLETWMFRLLLEYARVVDDQREEIGYAG